MVTANQWFLIILYGDCDILQFQQDEGSRLNPACSETDLL